MTGSDFGRAFGESIVGVLIAVGLVAAAVGGGLALAVLWVQQHVWLVLH